MNKKAEYKHQTWWTERGYRTSTSLIALLKYSHKPEHTPFPENPAQNWLRALSNLLSLFEKIICLLSDKQYQPKDLSCLSYF